VDKPKTTVVVNYPAECPKCKSRYFFPCIPIGQENLALQNISYFQCADSSCNFQWPVKLIRPDDTHHLVIAFTEEIPMGLLMLECDASSDAIMADMVDRIKKKFGNEALLFVTTMDRLMENSNKWLDFMKETDSLVELATSYMIDAPSRDQLLDMPGQNSEIRKMFEEGRAVSVAGVRAADLSRSDLSKLKSEDDE